MGNVQEPRFCFAVWQEKIFAEDFVIDLKKKKITKTKLNKKTLWHEGEVCVSG